MTGSVNRHILLKSRPEGAPSLDNFELTGSQSRATARC
jgi:NADPH-dependent curcumin reductase CurA